MTDEIKRLKKELKEWKSQEVKERFERVNSQLHLVTINELEHKIKRLKRGEETPSERETANELLPLVSGMLRSPEDIKEQAFKYAKTDDDEDSYDIKEKRAFEAGARWICGYEKDA